MPSNQIDPQEVSALCLEYVQNRDAFSKRAGSALFTPETAVERAAGFTAVTNEYANRLARVLDLGHDTTVWEAVAELASVHLSNIRASRETHRR